MGMIVLRLLAASLAFVCCAAAAPSFAQPPPLAPRGRVTTSTVEKSQPAPPPQPATPATAPFASGPSEPELGTPSSPTPEARSILSPPAPESVKEKLVAQRPARAVVTYLLDGDASAVGPEP